MIEIRTITVRLGEKDYTIREAGHLRAKPWRRRLMEEIKPLFEQLKGAQEIQFATPADLIRVMPLVESIFIDGLDTIYELLIAYSPEFEADQNYIENYATERQILAAFQEVVQLADPFGMIGQMNRQIGRAAIGTQSNSPSANGDSVSTKPQGSPSATRPA